MTKKTNGKSPATEPLPGRASEGTIGEIPDKQTVIEWVKRDMHAAHYFLGLLLRYPEIVERVANDILAHVHSRENGPAINSEAVREVEKELKEELHAD